MLCLEALVSLAPHEEELEKNEYTKVNDLHSCVLLNPGCRWGVALQRLVDSLLLLIETAPSSLPNGHCPQRLLRRLGTSGWYALGGGQAQCYPWPYNEQVNQVRVSLSSCLIKALESGGGVKS